MSYAVRRKGRGVKEEGEEEGKEGAGMRNEFDEL